jgi:predicted nucleotidyltransferase
MSGHPSTIDMIVIIANALGELNERAVFIGGATIPFYLPDVYLAQARPTEDVDIVMEIIGHNQNFQNDENLRKKGFKNDVSTGAPICRWIYKDLKVDIMSSDASALGFTNQWYQEGVERAIEIMSDPVKVKIFALPYFIATKIEAFKNRGKSDYAASPDMEDIISVLNVAPADMLEEQLSQCSNSLGAYLKKEFESLLKTSEFIDALPGAVFNRGAETAAVQAIKDRMKKFIRE